MHITCFKPKWNVWNGNETIETFKMHFVVRREGLNHGSWKLGLDQSYEIQPAAVSVVKLCELDVTNSGCITPKSMIVTKCENRALVRRAEDKRCCFINSPVVRKDRASTKSVKNEVCLDTLLIVYALTNQYNTNVFSWLCDFDKLLFSDFICIHFHVNFPDVLARFVLAIGELRNSKITNHINGKKLGGKFHFEQPGFSCLCTFSQLEFTHRQNFISIVFPLRAALLKRLEQKSHLTVVLPSLDWAQSYVPA